MMNWSERLTECKHFYKTIRLEDMKMIAKYSYIVHKSINYLDLSLLEFSTVRKKRRLMGPLMFCLAATAYPKKFVGTVEACRKTFIPERNSLYTLHLDLSQALEDTILRLNENEDVERWEANNIRLNELLVSDSVYKSAFRKFINIALEQNGMEMSFVRRQMALMKRILGIKPLQWSSLENRILKYLFDESADSDIMKEFLPHLDFNSWFLTHPEQDIFEYVVYHASRCRYNLKLNDSEGTLINQLFFKSSFDSIELLLKYQNAPFYYDYNIKILRSPYWIRNTPNDWTPRFIEKPLYKGLISKRRYLLWLQVFFSYTLNREPRVNSIVAKMLRLLWRYLPDSYFSMEEITRIYEDNPCNYEVMKVVHAYYVKVMGKDLISDKPRPLKHLCRASIRKSLSYNTQLPFGISELPLPQVLKLYLIFED